MWLCRNPNPLTQCNKPKYKKCTSFFLLIGLGINLTGLKWATCETTAHGTRQTVTCVIQAIETYSFSQDMRDSNQWSIFLHRFHTHCDGKSHYVSNCLVNLYQFTWKSMTRNRGKTEYRRWLQLSVEIGSDGRIRKPHINHLIMGINKRIQVFDITKINYCRVFWTILHLPIERFTTHVIHNGQVSEPCSWHDHSYVTETRPPVGNWMAWWRHRCVKLIEANRP